MKRFVVHAKKPGRLALVSIGNIKGQAYRLTFCLSGDALGEFLEREASVSSLSDVGACHGRHLRNSQTNESRRFTDRSRRAEPESARVDAVLLYLEVKGLVVGAQQPRRFALVAGAQLQRRTDGALFGVGDRRVRNLLQ